MSASASEPERVARALTQAYLVDGLPAIGQYMADDLEYESALLAGRFDGLGALRDALTEAMRGSRLQMTPKELIRVGEDAVIVRGSYVVRTGTGRVDRGLYLAYRIRDGKVVQGGDYAGLAEARAAIARWTAG